VNSPGKQKIPLKHIDTFGANYFLDWTAEQRSTQAEGRRRMGGGADCAAGGKKGDEKIYLLYGLNEKRMPADERGKRSRAVR